MKKIIFAQALTTNGITEFSGLYDENGNPVVVEMEYDGAPVRCIRYSRVKFPT